MEPIRINLGDYARTGEGANGESFDCISDSSVMVKLYNTSYPVKPIFDELEVARKVYELGIPSPEPGEIVTDGQRLGIRFRRIVGKRSFSRIFADEAQRTEEFAREMARFCKKLHSVECPEGLFPDSRQQFRDMLDQMDFFTGDEKSYLNGILDSIPDSNTALHGDLHFGNIICTLPEGAPLSVPHDTYFIDLGYFAHGHPIIDLGMMMNVCQFGTEDFIMRDMHITKAHAERILDFFLDEYFFAEDDIARKWFGPGQDLDSVKAVLCRSYCLKSILVSFNLGIKLPEFEEELHRQMKETGI